MIKFETESEYYTLLNQSLWNNASYQDKTYFSQRWYRAGIQTIRDIVNPNGSFKSYQALHEEYNTDNNTLVYAKLLAIIPETWKVALGSSDCLVTLTPRISPMSDVCGVASLTRCH